MEREGLQTLEWGPAWPLAEPERGEHGRRLGQEGAGFTLIGPGFPSWSSAGPLEAGRMWASEGTREGLACVGLEGAAQSHRHPEMASRARTAWIDRAQGPGPKTGPTISAGDAPQVPPIARRWEPRHLPFDGRRALGGVGMLESPGLGLDQVTGYRAMGGRRGRPRVHTQKAARLRTQPHLPPPRPSTPLSTG